MRKKALTLVEVMVSLSIIVLLAVIVITSILSPKIIMNERHARQVLKDISKAYEAYASQHKGSYNETLKNLANQSIYNPPYLGIDFSSGTYNGYNFNCLSSNTGYLCNAKPQIYRETGTKSFSICAGGVLKEASAESAPACP